MQSVHNYIFSSTGAGTGKSFLLKIILQQLVRKYDSHSVFITATTGLAACSLGGTTVHQFGGFRPSDEELFASGHNPEVLCLRIISFIDYF